MHANSELDEINMHTNALIPLTHANSDAHTHTSLVRRRLRFLINIIDPGRPCDAAGRHCEVVRVRTAHWAREPWKTSGERDKKMDGKKEA